MAGIYDANLTARVGSPGRESLPAPLVVSVTTDAPPKQVHIQGDGVPPGPGHGEEITIGGRVSRSAHKGWNESAAPGALIVVRFGPAPRGSTVDPAVTGPAGEFSFNCSATERPGDYLMEAEARDGAGLLEPSTASFNVSMGPPPVLLLLIDRGSERFAPAVGQSFVVHGPVPLADILGRPVEPAENVLVQIMFVNPFQPDAIAGRPEANGRFMVVVLGCNEPRTYNMNVVARDDASGLQAAPMPITAVVGSEAPANASPMPGDFPWIAVAALASAGALGPTTRGARRRPPLKPR